jgi:hypothetical protein
MSDTTITSALSVGDHVRVQRDEALRPSKGTWPTVRGKTGYVCIVSDGAGPNGEPEYGVVLTVTRPAWRQEKGRRHELQYDSEAIKWFAPHELVAIAS